MYILTEILFSLFNHKLQNYYMHDPLSTRHVYQFCERKNSGYFMQRLEVNSYLMFKDSFRTYNTSEPALLSNHLSGTILIVIFPLCGLPDLSTHSPDSCLDAEFNFSLRPFRVY